MHILTLDAATSTGWTLGVPGKKPKHGTFVIPPTMRHGGRFAYAHINWLDKMLEPFGRDDVRVVYEKSILPADTNIDMLLKLYGLATCIQYTCFARGVPCKPIDAATWRSSMLGPYAPVRRKGMKKGEMRRLYKEAAIKVAGLLGYVVQTDDEAESILIWEHEAALENPRWGAARALATLGDKVA